MMLKLDTNHIYYLKKEIAYLKTQIEERGTGHIRTAISVLEKRVATLQDEQDIVACYKCNGRGLIYEAESYPSDPDNVSVNAETCHVCMGATYLKRKDRDNDK